jgi:hypothetical protein
MQHERGRQEEPGHLRGVVGLREFGTHSLHEYRQGDAIAIPGGAANGQRNGLYFGQKMPARARDAAGKPPARRLPDSWTVDV